MHALVSMPDFKGGRRNQGIFRCCLRTIKFLIWKIRALFNNPTIIDDFLADDDRLTGISPPASITHLSPLGRVMIVIVSAVIRILIQAIYSSGSCSFYSQKVITRMFIKFSPFQTLVSEDNLKQQVEVDSRLLTVPRRKSAHSNVGLSSGFHI